jgi:hypothetical protein
MTSSNQREKRKHARVSHTGTVEFVTDGRRFRGKSVNVSRSGMQVEVRLPDSFESVRRVTFTLPTSDTAISLPFRFVRSDAGTDEHVVGLEFDFEDETQKLLIERFIRDMKQREDEEGADEQRRVPRTECRLEDVACSRADVTVHSIDNVSTEGLLFTFEGALDPGADLELRAALPNSGKSLKLAGRVMYVIAGSGEGTSVAGMRLHPGSEVHEARLRNFISEQRSTDALRNAYESFAESQDDASDFRLDDPKAIIELLREAAHRSVVVNTLSERTLRLLECRIGSVSADAGMTLHPAGEDAAPTGTPQSAKAAEAPTRSAPVSGTADPPPASAAAPASPEQDPEAVYVAFPLDGGSYLFKTTGEITASGAMTLGVPEIVYRSEKRSSERRDSGGDPKLRIRPQRDSGGP